DNAADQLANARNDALNKQRQLNETYAPGAVSRYLEGTVSQLGQIALMQGLGMPVIPTFGVQTFDQSLTAARDAGVPKEQAEPYALTSAALQTGLMAVAGRIAKSLGVTPREELLQDWENEARNLMTKEGLTHALKDVTFQAGEGAAIHVA